MSPKKRAKVAVEPSVVNEISKMAMSKKERAEAQRVRVYYDVPDWLKMAGERAAKKEGTSASQMGAFLLAWAQRLYWQGDEDLLEALENSKQPSRSLKLEWNVEIPAELQRIVLDEIR